MTKVLLFIFILFNSSLFSQIKDTVRIGEVKVRANRIFKEKNPGLKKEVIDTMILREQGTMTLSELLGENSPIFIKSYGKGTLATASYRGTAPSHTQVYWNGININSPMLGMVDFSLIPVALQDEVSLLNGNSSLTCGTGGLGGAITLNNKPNWTQATNYNFSQGFSSYSGIYDFFSVNTGNGKWQLKSKIYYDYCDNDFKFLNKSIPSSVDLETGAIQYATQKYNEANYQKYGIQEDFWLKVGNQSIFSFNFWYQNSDRNIPKLASNQSGDNSSYSKEYIKNKEEINKGKISKQLDKSIRIATNYKYYLKDFNFNLSLGYSNSDLDFSTTDFVNNKRINSINSISTIHSFFSGLKFNAKVKGFDLYSSVKLNIHNVDSKEEVKKTAYAKERIEVLYSLSLKRQILPKLRGMVIANLEYVDQLYYDPLYSISFDYEPIKNILLFKSAYSTNHHLPTLNDLYMLPGGNPKLKAEENQSIDVGVKFQNKSKLGNLIFSADYYYNSISNWIIWLPTAFGYWKPFNVKRVDAQGVEFKLDYVKKFKNFKLRLIAAYAITKSINKGEKKNWADGSIGKQLVYIPKQSANSSLGLYYKNWELKYTFNYFSTRYTTSSNKKNSLRDYLYPYYMSNISLIRKFTLNTFNCELRFKVNNLLNEEYRSILQRPMPKMNYAMLIKIKW